MTGRAHRRSSLLTAIVLMLVAGACKPAPPPPPPSATLAVGERLNAGQRLLSTDGVFSLEMQGDGNLVLYRVSDMVAQWSTVTAGHSGAWFQLQPDGNAVVYSADTQPLWSSSTMGTGTSIIGLQPDGNLVARLPDGRPTWSRFTGLTGNSVATLGAGQSLSIGMALRSTDGAFSLEMQGDGNLVLYRVSDMVAQWNSQTIGRGGQYVEMQTDGNLVVYTAQQTALWNSGTSGSGGNRLALQPDGNLVIYTSGSRAVWSVFTGRIGGTTGGVIGDDYPAVWRNAAQDSLIDTWRYYNRECTSFVAWRLHSANGFEMPAAIGNAGVWQTWFRNHGYTVNNTPARGAIAESSGHVAWVSSVNGDGTVTIEEYNADYQGHYSTRRVAVGAFHYIHARDL